MHGVPLSGFMNYIRNHADMDSEGACSSYPNQYFYSSLTDCEGDHNTLMPSVADANSVDEADQCPSMHLPMSVWAHLYLRMALKAADVGRLGLDEMEISTVLSPLV